MTANALTADDAAADAAADKRPGNRPGKRADGRTGTAIRRLQAHEWPLYRRLRLRSLADAPHAFGSTLALEASWQPALWMARLVAASTSGRDCPLVAEAAHAAGAAVGLLWAKCDPADAGIVDLFQMWVAPDARGCGVGASLLDAAIGWARSIGAHDVRLGVVTGNDAATRLYARMGFRAVGAPAPIRPGAHALEQTMRLCVRT